MSICRHTNAYAYTHVYTCTYAHSVYTCIYADTYTVHIHIHMHKFVVHRHIHKHIQLYIYMYKRIHVAYTRTNTYVYTFIYTVIHIHIHIHIYIYILIGSFPCSHTYSPFVLSTHFVNHKLPSEVTACTRGQEWISCRRPCGFCFLCVVPLGFRVLC